MRNVYRNLLLIIFASLLIIPVNTYALESNNESDEIITNTSDSTEIETNESKVNTELTEDEELDPIKNIISDNIDVDLLESQGFDYDENESSIVEKEVVKEIEKKLDENNINHENYSIVGDIVNSNEFPYSGEIHIYKGEECVATVETGVTYSNTDQHKDAEQAHVNNFIETNNFDYVEEINLEDYESANISLENKLNTIASKYGITCKSMLSPATNVTSNFPFACFFNDKYYGSLIANLDVIINVNVPANITNDKEYVINAVKNYFINYFNKLGITNVLTENSKLYYNNGTIYSDNISLGNFKYTKAKEPSQTPASPQQTNNNQSSNTNKNYNNSNRGYSYGYSSYKSYYTANEEQEEIKETVDNNKIEKSTKKANKKETTKKDSKKTVKKETKKDTNKKTRKAAKKDSKEEQEKAKSGSGIKKILFILVASILSVGIVLFVVDKFFNK